MTDLLGLLLKMYREIYFPGADNSLTLAGKEVQFLLACLIIRNPEDP